MNVLVTYGSKMGGTRGIAEQIADRLRASGFAVDVVPAEAVRSAAEYDAAVVGGALYAMRWHRDARRFVRRNAKELRAMPVWLFSSGPLDDSATHRDIPPVPHVRRLAAKIRARGHMTFGGRLPADAHGFPAHAMAKDHAGDWRDLGQIDAWATTIASALSRSETPVAHG